MQAYKSGQRFFIERPASRLSQATAHHRRDFGRKLEKDCGAVVLVSCHCVIALRGDGNNQFGALN